MKKRKRKNFRVFFFIDYKLFIPIILLTSIGLLAIVDVSAPKAMETFSDHFYFLKQQSVWVILGLLIYIIISQINFSLWEKYAKVILLVVIICLVAVLIPGLGTRTYGAQRWLNIGFIRFQPSEFAKLAICIYFAKLAVYKKGLMSYVIPLILVTGLIIIQPDLGTTAVIAAIALTQIYISEISLKKLSIFFIIGIVITSLLIASSSYRRERVVSFLDPFSKISDSTYHVRQLLYALAIGGISGVGIGQSTQKYLFLPEATTDSIFAVIAEEVGFIGVLAIILLYLYIFYRMIKSIKNIQNPFALSFTVGVFAWFSGQTFINLASVSSLIPFTGVPLPFISYGGSTLLSFFIAFAIFNSIIKYSNYHEK